MARLSCCLCLAGEETVLTALLASVKYCEMFLLSCSVRSAALDIFPRRLLYPASRPSPAVSVI